MAIDLRSDTVTRPTPAMRKAMADAEVGDDYYRDDPTVRALEERAAAMLGKEAGLLMFSATMANAVALLAHTQRGDSVILEESCHINNNEAGHVGVIAGLTTRTVKGERGFIAPDRLAEVALPRGEVLHSPTTLACLENTHNASGGACISTAQMRSFRAAAEKLRLAVHVDGARFFNAAVAEKASPADLARDADTVTLCLTKGLACPMGALLVGPRDLIAKARHARQMVGGGMRQGGVFAAAGLVALDQMIDRLADDHATAKHLAAGLAELGFGVDPAAIETNMVYVNLPASIADGRAFTAELGRQGVKVNTPRGRRQRFVTHWEITPAAVEEAIAAVGRTLQAMRMPAAANA